ncbi:WhiB family transcriptional regulator [Mycobacterium malmoense]|uniref:WhiB family transcriptional regulator n=1 Tax=Mycobacterium malmoense TaxID=1780 RepID=UPI00350E3EFA
MALVWAAVNGGPVLPGALCRGRAPGWDVAGLHRTARSTTPAAVTICQQCPELAACARWAERQPELTGIYAGQLYRPDRGAETARTPRPRRRRRKPISHGTDAGYAARCRCARCRAAHADAHRAWRIRAQIPSGSPA